MTTVSLELLVEILSTLRRSSEEFVREMRLAAAIHWYERGEISQENAARIAGVDRTNFLLALTHERAESSSSRSRISDKSWIVGKLPGVNHLSLSS